jgi:uncharacterized peroxidase-related enzyme
MAHLPSLPEPAHLADLFARFPENVKPLMDFTDGLLRADGALSVAERELIASYVSGLNACRFCYGSHKAYAELFGVDGDLVEALIDDPDNAPVDDRLRPILAYVRKLNTLPSRIVPADAQAVYDAGWDERALYEAVQVCALFNMMNRIVEGAGIDFDYADAPETHPAAGSTPDAHARSYAAFGDKIAARLRGEG